MTAPKWSNIPALRSPDPSLGSVLGDIESHMPAGHRYRASRMVTWAHETTHGLNARIRNQYLVRGQSTNACYVLEDRAMVLVEPTKINLNTVAAIVPLSLRGMSYDLYLIRQQQYWLYQPLYVLDEWSAYANGVETAISFDGGDGSFSDVLQLLEFMTYGMVLAYGVETNYTSGIDNFRLFIMWMVERTITLFKKSRKFPALVDRRQDNYLDNLRTAMDADWLRTFVSSTLGDIWFRKWIMGENWNIFNFGD